MNERVARVGDQVKQAFTKVVDAWKNQEATRRKRIIFAGIALVLAVILLVIILNVVDSRYVVVYEGMSREESVTAVGVLETASIPSRVNSAGELEVPSKNLNAAMAQLALQGIPAITPSYNLIEKASGLTTTETEKQAYLLFQWQDRLQDTIRSMTGVQSATVSLKLGSTSNRVWDPETTKSSGSAFITMKSGFVLSAQQANAIRYLIGASVGIDPLEVVVMDQNGTMLAAPGEEYSAASVVVDQFLDRMSLANEVEQRLSQKAATIVAQVYPNLEEWTVVSTANLNFDAMLTEIKEYFPLEGTDHGVTDQEELDYVMGPGQLAEGVVGETDNTDVPIYVDLDGDGVPETIDYHRFRDYAVSYSLQQIEKDGPNVESAFISVMVNDPSMSDEKRLSLRQAVATATGLPLDNVTVQNMIPNVVDNGDGTGTGGGIFGDIPDMFLYIAAAAVVALILVLVLVMVLRNRGKKKKLLLAEAEAAAEQEEAERIQQEIEERKRQLKDAAIGDESENAITNEVRAFARSNPEITANLLRNWLKEGE